MTKARNTLPSSRRVKAAVEQVGGISSDAVARATGRSWAEWTRILDRAGARKLVHKDIAEWLHRNYGQEISGWWCQMLTVGYEQKRGLRAVGQKADGYSANASKTIAAQIGEVYRVFANAKSRSRLLDGARHRITTATESKSMRIAWVDPESRVSINFYAKGKDKCLVQVEHMKLPNDRARLKLKSYWRLCLERLSASIVE